MILGRSQYAEAALPPDFEPTEPHRFPLIDDSLDQIALTSCLCDKLFLKTIKDFRIPMAINQSAVFEVVDQIKSDRALKYDELRNSSNGLDQLLSHIY